jgi:subtilisin family serine protease
MSYPANYPEVVAVGAIGSTGLPAYFSSYGTNLDILAPGTNIYTSSWSASNSTSAYASNIAGTSLATPLISGALTTLRSLLPNASQTELLALLTENTDRMTLSSNQNRSNTLGYGAADIYKASQRSIVPFSSTQITSFSPVSYGGTLFPNSPANINGKNSIYQCAVGTTPVYKLTLGSSVVYSSSMLETAQAQMQGYSTSLFTYLCSLQPHDTVGNVRLLNIEPEFENFFRK